MPFACVIKESWLLTVYTVNKTLCCSALPIDWWVNRSRFRSSPVREGVRLSPTIVSGDGIRERCSCHGGKLANCLYCQTLPL